jgi:hypothetical protein
MVGWYKDRNGKWWSPEERTAVGKQTRQLIKEGKYDPVMICERCEQSEGIIHMHNHDYSHPTENIEILCWRCHMMFHSVRRNKNAVDKYFIEIANGKKWPPVHKHDFGILNRDHGV